MERRQQGEAAVLLLVALFRRFQSHARNGRRQVQEGKYFATVVRQKGSCWIRGASFIVDGAIPAKNSALTSAGAELRLANGLTLLAKFDGEFASHSSTYAGTGTLRYRW
jgi:hypothetical protein